MSWKDKKWAIVFLQASFTGVKYLYIRDIAPPAKVYNIRFSQLERVFKVQLIPDLSLFGIERLESSVQSGDDPIGKLAQ